MKRLHIHIAVDDLQHSIGFYSIIFSAQPSVTQTDYAKWMLDNPCINFAISQRGAAVGLNHLGIQVENADELAEMHGRLQNLAAPVKEESEARCCYAKSDKYWVTDPAGIAWETFHTLDTIPVFGQEANANPASDCCIPLAATTKEAACCVPKQGSSCCA